MRVAEFALPSGGSVWVNPMLVQTIRAGDRHRGGSEIRLYGQESWAATWVPVEPAEAARILSEAMA